MDELKLKLGARIRVLRQYWELSQPALGSKVNRCASAVSQIEVGGASMTVSQLLDYAEKLGVSAETLLKGLAKPPKTRIPDDAVAELFEYAEYAQGPRGDHLPPALRKRLHDRAPEQVPG